ncbi:MAG: virulence RhuM family protein [Tannerella sp.]|jgi:hypothetical protein|nr:virulence RhuM family protein [Tannerella sp.]
MEIEKSKTVEISTIPTGEIILYQTGDHQISIDVKIVEETVWLTQEQIAELFGTKRPAITKHLNNIYKSGELVESSTCSKMEHVSNEAAQRYKTKYYNLDAILSVGYRVNSIHATLFRIWATRVLKEFLLKGIVVNQRFERLEHRMTEAEKNIDFFVKTSLPPVEGVFFEGQVFDAYVLAAKIIGTAKRSIILIDNYIDESVLVLFGKKAPGVKVSLFTPAISEQLALDVKRANAQYPTFVARVFEKSHDRFLIIDETDVYLLWASLKDLGKKWFAFSRMEKESVSVINKIKEL